MRQYWDWISWGPIIHLIYTNISYCSLPPTHTVLLRHAICILLHWETWLVARHLERERMICKTKTSWSLSSRKTNFFIGILKDTNGDTVREKETGKWSDLSSQLLAYGEVFFPTSAPFSKEEAKERWAVRTRMCAASENEDSRSGDSFEWVILLVLSLIWVYSIKRMRGVCVQACVYALVRAGLYKCIIFLRIFLMVSTS